MKNKRIKLGKTLYEVASDILALNPNAGLTGSLMLQIRGIDLERDPHDIDIIINDYASEIVLPKYINYRTVKEQTSDGEWAKYVYNGIVIDVRSNEGEGFEEVNGLLLGQLSALMKAKSTYCLQEKESAKKHSEDLDKIIEQLLNN